MNDANMVYIVICLVIIAISVPLILEKVPPNALYGFRTRKTMSDQSIWYKANKFGGAALAAAGIVSLACFLLIRLAPDALTFIRKAPLWTLLVPLVIAVLASFLYLRRL